MQNLLRLISSIFKNVKTTLLVLVLALAIIAALATAVSMSGAQIPILEPKGEIARQQKDLLIISTLLMLIVVVPVFILLFTISMKFRASNTKAKYQPEWDHSKKLEAIWWGVPCLIILILASITWFTSHSLDPFKPLASTDAPLRIQVVAQQWKWLFIYPDEQIASVNKVVMPVNRAVTFEITSDAPMNSFWIPSLAGQVYAMSGMTTQLHIRGDTVGDYRGSSANISGEGFAGMHFAANVVSNSDYKKWTLSAQNSQDILTREVYVDLAKPSKNNPEKTYVAADPDLFMSIIDKYMSPQGTPPTQETQYTESTDMEMMEHMHAH